jgi:hypothetical protein
MPELTQRINSESFLARLKSKLPHHSVVSHWTRGNTNLRPAQLSPVGPLIIHCSTLIYGVRRWSLFGHGWGLDEKRTEQLKLDLQVALKELLNGGGPHRRAALHGHVQGVSGYQCGNWAVGRGSGGSHTGHGEHSAAAPISEVNRPSHERRKRALNGASRWVFAIGGPMTASRARPCTECT